ncbi:MAG: hypothetical protein NWE95_07095 [Candidatus Bathyarchaeota archaeon]|nr:hypothetical protein [Candidatus Bathyarchaeota archaeon]
MKLDKGKLLGLAFFVVSIAVLAICIYHIMSIFWLSSINIPIILVLIIVVVPCSLGLLIIACKLLLYNSERIVTLDEVRKRTTKSSKKAKFSSFPLVIYFCGIDGSGKTTQINLIAENLKRERIKFKYVWLRWAAFLSYPFLAFCRLMGFTKWKTVPKSNRKFPEHQLYRNKAIAKIWSALITLDMFVYSFLKITIPLKLGYIVLCDRFALDGLVDLMYETKNHEILTSFPGRALLSLISRQSIMILLDISAEEAWNRKCDIPSIGYLRQRRNLYLRLSCYLGIPVLDSIKSQAELHQEIVKRFLEHYPFWWARAQKQ